MKLSDVIPPSDLLTQFDGLESGLRKRRNLNRFGVFGGLLAIAISTIEVGLKAAENEKTLATFEALWEFAGWWLALPALGIVLITIAIWYERLLKESDEAIRYTCSLGEFSAVCAEHEDARSTIAEKMAWLPHDLARHMNQRIQRLMFSNDVRGRASNGDGPSSPHANGLSHAERSEGKQHIHICGHYLIRRATSTGAGSAESQLLVMPRVRIGPESNPEKLARPVSFVLKGDSAILDVTQYDDLCEQVYFSVVTEVYRQIRDDVKNKIALLPTGHHKAIAYLCEANDYARSNTFQAYNEAGELYRLALRCFQPRNALVALPPSSPLGRSLRSIVLQLARLGRLVAVPWVQLRPAAARNEILAAKAMLGYANMLVFRRSLGSLLGQRTVVVFEARPFTERALTTLATLPESAPGRRETMFDAYVTKALVCSLLGEQDQSRLQLEQAQALDPSRATTSVLYQLARVQGPQRPRLKYDTLLRIVEQEPRFEMAQFERAYHGEISWRAEGSPTRARVEANLVIAGYEDVLRLNPSNIAAAANAGYVRWLLGEHAKAEDHFKGALRYKELAPETHVAEQYLGLARLYAEQGHFELSHEHLLRASDSVRAHRLSHSTDMSLYFFRWIDEDVFTRFRRYRDAVLDYASKPDAEASSDRVRDAVCAFVLDEYGEACMHFYRYRKRDESVLALGIEAFRESVRKSQHSPVAALMPKFHLAAALAFGTSPQYEERRRILEEIVHEDPEWIEASLELARTRSRGPAQSKARARSLREKAQGIEGVLSLLEAVQTTSKAQPLDSWTKERTPGGSKRPSSSDDQTENNRLKQELKRALDQLDPPIQSDGGAGLLDELKARLKHNASEAEKADEEAERSVLEAQKPASELLPHDWLWRSFAKRKMLDMRAFDDRGYQASARWERELNEWHVEALCSYARPLLEASDAISTANARRILRMVRERFYSNWTVLTESLAVEQEERKKQLAMTLTGLVKRACEDDPRNVENLEWLGDDRLLLEPGERAELLQASCKLGAFPSPTILKPLITYLFEQADRHLAANEPAAAVQRLTEIVESRTDNASRARARALLSVVCFLEGDITAASGRVVGAIPELFNALRSAYKEPHGPLDQYLAVNEKTRIQLKLHCEHLLHDAQNAETARYLTDFTMGILDVACASYLREESLDKDPFRFASVRAPLIIEWSADLLSAVSDETMNDFLINDLVRWLRDGLENEYGVRIPGVRFRAVEDPLTAKYYRIIDHEVVVDEGNVSVATGSADWRDPLRYTVARLKQHLERHLARWVGPQEVQNLLERHCSEFYHPNVAGSIAAVETHTHILPLTAVVRSLVSERAPIRGFGSLYKVYRDCKQQGASQQTTVALIRKLPEIRSSLWGNDPQRSQFVLSDAFESELLGAMTTLEGFDTLCLPRKQRDELVQQLVAVVGGPNNAPCVVTVQSSKLRPLLRRMVEDLLPEIPVLADEELNESLRAREPVVVPLPANPTELKVSA